MRIHKLLFIFSAERAHFVGMLIVRAIGLCYWSFSRFGLWPKTKQNKKVQTPFGEIDSALGLAAGFDKNAKALFGWEALGFSFVEVGTITPKPQSGSPKPRLFRYTKIQALVNRMGFNNDGAYIIARRIFKAKKNGLKIKVGGNIGKNLTTPIDQVAKDYTLAALALKDVVDYLVINVSSPNTPGLRELQSEQNLSEIVRQVKLAAPNTPIFIKVAPDQAVQFMADVENVVKKFNLSGVICANTLSEHSYEKGGLSGVPLKEKNLELCRKYASQNPNFFIIGVGGIFTSDDAWAYLKSGAKAIQIYTGLVYEGPCLPRRLIKGLKDHNVV